MKCGNIVSRNEKEEEKSSKNHQTDAEGRELIRSYCTFFGPYRNVQGLIDA